MADLTQVLIWSSIMWLIMIAVTVASVYWKPLFAKDSDNVPVLIYKAFLSDLLRLVATTLFLYIHFSLFARDCSDHSVLLSCTTVVGSYEGMTPVHIIIITSTSDLQPIRISHPANQFVHLATPYDRMATIRSQGFGKSLPL